MEAAAVAMRAVVGEGGQPPHLAAAYPLDLDHVGAEIGELLPGAGDGDAVPTSTTRMPDQG